MGEQLSLQQASSDPLSESKSISELAIVDVIRDPLHGDIRITKLERCLIDSPMFQRLRKINQLGLTQLVYPGALHTRFLHSIGVLHVCSEMLEACDRNADLYGLLGRGSKLLPLRLTGYQRFLARLVALLHDLAHVPFGHTLEKEANIFADDEWADVRRVAFLRRELRQILSAYFQDNNIGRGIAEDILAVQTVSKDDISKLRYPFIHDLVSNTLCADLVDYVTRDSFFCGLEERFGRRFLDYVAIIPVHKENRRSDWQAGAPGINHANRAFETVKLHRTGFAECRLCLLSYRYNESHQAVRKLNVLSEAVDLVRRRFSIAEKIYFHRTKLSLSAMFATAFARSGLTARDIYLKSDSEVIELLRNSGDVRASALAKKVTMRQCFKPVYRADYIPYNRSTTLWSKDGPYERLRDVEGRLELEARLERLIHLSTPTLSDSHGLVVVSCPDHNMNRKEAEMMVVMDPNGDFFRLFDADDEHIQSQLKTLDTAHKKLWSLAVLLDPKVVSEMRDLDLNKLIGVMKFEIGAENSVREFANVPDCDGDSWFREMTLKDDLRHLQVDILQQHFEGLLNAAGRNLSEDVSSRREMLSETLVDLGYQVRVRG